MLAHTKQLPLLLPLSTSLWSVLVGSCERTKPSGQLRLCVHATPAPCPHIARCTYSSNHMHIAGMQRRRNALDMLQQEAVRGRREERQLLYGLKGSLFWSSDNDL